MFISALAFKRLQLRNTLMDSMDKKDHTVEKSWFIAKRNGVSLATVYGVHQINRSINPDGHSMEDSMEDVDAQVYANIYI